MSSTRFERLTDLDAERPILVEGLPGTGLVASITVDLLTRQLSLGHHGTILSDTFPPVASFNDGTMRDPVRVYSGRDPDVMTLHSDVVLPEVAYRALAQVVLGDLAPEFERAIFIAGAPATEAEPAGDVVGVATTDTVETELAAANVPLAEGVGLIGGVTGALLLECFHAGVPAAALVVRCAPYEPDPLAAKTLVETALEPLVHFEIEADELETRAEEIGEQLQQVADHFQETQTQQLPSGTTRRESSSPSMFQ